MKHRLHNNFDVFVRYLGGNFMNENKKTYKATAYKRVNCCYCDYSTKKMKRVCS